MVTVVQCVNNLDLGGVEQLVLTLSRRYYEQGYGSMICCIEDRGALADQAEAAGVAVHALQIQQRGKRTGFHDLRRLLREHRPLVLHSHNFKPFYYGALATLFGATDGHIHSRHGSLLQHHPAIWRYRLLRPWVDEWVTVSADRQQELAERTGLPRERIHIVPNGVDTARFCPATDKLARRIELGLSTNCPAIICVARLAPEKDLPSLLRAFAIVRQKLSAAELWFVGYGPEQTKLVNLARELGLTGSARFGGRRSDTQKFLQAADVFALSSLSEGLSVALIEAAACGLPIVATNVGGNHEVVNAPRGGRLVPPGNPDALATALLEVLTNDTLRTGMSQAARQHALAQFSVDRMVNGYLALYEEALSKRGLSFGIEMLTSLNRTAVLRGEVEAQSIPAAALERVVPDFAFNPLYRRGLLYKPVFDDPNHRPVWPGGKAFAVCLTHDVDRVTEVSCRHACRYVATALKSQPPLSRGEIAYQIALASRRFCLALLRTGRPDRLWCYERWLDAEERVGARSTFFFFPDNVSLPHFSDLSYSFDDVIRFRGKKTPIAALMRELAVGDWEVGLHSSWHAATDVAELKAQKARVEQAIGQPVTSVRQHWLRYDIRTTPRIHADAGFRFDSTLGFNNNVGFRFGTSLPWILTDLQTNQPLAVCEIPLIAQDTAMLNPLKGLRLDLETAFSYLMQLLEEVMSVGGVFTLSFHPENIHPRRCPGWFDLYVRILAELKARDPWFATLRQVGEHWLSTTEPQRAPHT